MKTLVCPTDFSEIAENGARYAYDLAQSLQFRLLLLHAFHLSELAPVDGTYVPERVVDDLAAQCDDKLHTLAQQLGQEQPEGTAVEVITRSRSGFALEAIIAEAEAQQAALIVMGTGGDSGLAKLLGTLTAEVAVKAPCPVLVVPEGQVWEPFRKIAVVVDEHERLSDELPVVLAMARQSNAQLFFFHALTEADDQTKHETMKRFEHIYQTVDYPQVSCHFNEHASVEDGILEFIQWLGADLLVMTHHTRRFWQALFHRSWTRRLAQHTHLPLLVLHDAQA
ncbi:Nucleotide-binding universal stress protein, UspA family [Catalinimonas alkaloidigena]|uniref:Nucleotide-binding universal stress protein, UspA family n=1 Tax=Catalinimonas alkaloidigena TaxID=1075417 RepID=A0A1G9NZW3_9BACT|nr:universal stress protein [Catalinimonas alkaloidigena]SDL91515.1 Nucleotide-binding universal stress protein, UspA family [Catalinimonas alkaloidigena]